jgi:nucleotide-binding universal stress UspA family protein
MRYARDLAARGEATLVVAHAWTPPGGEIADSRAPSPVLGDIWQNAAWQQITDCVAAAWGGMPADVPTSLIVARGPTGRILVGLGERDDDVLVVGAGRRGPLARLGHGRVVRYCLTHARCPVLAIPPASLERYARRGLRSAFRLHPPVSTAVIDRGAGR